MKADSARDAKTIADQALEQLANDLRAGGSQQLTTYLAMLAKFHAYSFGNVLLILTQKPEATRVAGFNAWKRLGRHVKKGEKGIVIIAPMALRPREDDVENDEDPKPVLRFRAVHVFDVSQTDGDPLPEMARVHGDPMHNLDAIKRIVRGHGITLDHDDLPANALGVSRGGRISVRSDLTPAEEFSVIVHELAHELLHRGEDRKTLSKLVRETEAEAVAYVVNTAIGLDPGSASADYIRLYDASSDNAAHALASSLHRIQKTAATIIAELQDTAKSSDQPGAPELANAGAADAHAEELAQPNAVKTDAA